MGKLLLIALVLVGVWFFFFSEAPSSPEGANPRATSQMSGEGQSSVNAEQRILALADREGLLVRFGESEGRDLPVRIEWSGNQATPGGEFLLVLLDEGVIGDFDQVGKGQRRSNDQGGWIWSQEFILKLKQ